MPIAPLIPVTDFFRPPTRSRAQLSPDGTLVAYLAPWRNRLNVWVRDVDSDWSRPDQDSDEAPDGGDQDARRLTADDRRSIESFWWSRDGRSVLHLQDGAGEEDAHLFRVDLHSGRSVDLTPYPGVRMMGFSQSRHDPTVAHIWLNLRSPELIDTYRIDLGTGELTLLLDATDRPGRTTLVAPDGRVYQVGLTGDGDWELSRDDDGTATPLTIFHGPDYPLGPLSPQFTPDGTGLWLGSNRGSDRTRLVRVDLVTGEQHGVDSHPVLDLDTPRPEVDPSFPAPLLVHPATGELLAARYLGERTVVHALDPHFAEVLPRLQELSDGDLGHVSCDDTAQRWVVDFEHDRDPGVTWFYDHRTGEARRLFRPFPDLDPDALAAVACLTVRSRDGLDLPCHLTLPVGTEPRDLATVVLLHGGPWFRDSWCYDPEVQLLANRGYAVLQVDFRGSTGYGKAFLKAGIGEFAGRMHDDVIDALDHLVDQGVSDRDRVAVYGCSYGGYAALVGATFTPARFAAAISYTGMSDLVRLHEESLPAVRAMLVNSYGLHIGDPDEPEQRADMLARSPASYLDRITAPVLLIHGEQDVRVSRAHSDVVHGALQRRGVEVEYLVNPDEGHWFVNPESKVELYQRLERFLARHVGGRSEDAG